MMPISLAWILLAADESSADWMTLTNYGVLGIFAIILLGFARWLINRETARADRLEAEVVRLNDVIASKVIPALLSATGAVESSTEMLRDLQRDLRDGYPGRRPRLDEGR